MLQYKEGERLAQQKHSLLVTSAETQPGLLELSGACSISRQAFQANFDLELASAVR